MKPAVRISRETGTSLAHLLNGYFVGAINRVGHEAPWNIGEFYGQSYFCDPRGQIIAEASRDKDELVVADLNMDMIREVRNTCEFFQRPDGGQTPTNPGERINARMKRASLLAAGLLFCLAWPIAGQELTRPRARSVTRLPIAIVSSVTRLSADARQCLRDNYQGQTALPAQARSSRVAFA